MRELSQGRKATSWHSLDSNSDLWIPSSVFSSTVQSGFHMSNESCFGKNFLFEGQLEGKLHEARNPFVLFSALTA